MRLEEGYLLSDRYRITGVLGEGGMGAVYKAEDESLSVQVAVKENLISDEVASRQFRREATILANLRHPNLPRVTDHFIIPEQVQYLVMDFVEGEDLKQRIKRLGALDEKEVILIGVAICEALDYLHSLDSPVVHRDIKPGNIKVAPNGHVFLVDFGLVKVFDSGKETTTGARGMSPGFSPPEQYGSARTDARSDIYSLGATLYAALSGSTPEDSLSIMINQSQLTPLRRHNPKVGSKLAGIIERALSMQPDERFQTAVEFKQALLSASDTISRQVAKGEVSVEPPPQDSVTTVVSSDKAGSKPVFAPTMRSRGKRPSRIYWWIGGAIMVCLAIAVITSVFAGPDIIANMISPNEENIVQPVASNTVEGVDTSTPEDSAAQEVEDNAEASKEPEIDTPVEATPMGGGQQIAFASMRLGTPQIFLIDLATEEIQQLTTIGGGACQPSWSPDGSELVFISPCNTNKERYTGSGLFLVNADGTNVTPLPSSPGGDYDPDWSPLGDKIAFTSLRQGNRPNIYVLDLASGNIVNLSGTVAHDYQPGWSPDGKMIAFVTTRSGPTQIWTMDASGRPWQAFSRSNDLVNFDPLWSPDMQMILFTQFTGSTDNRAQIKAALWHDGGKERGFNEFMIIDRSATTREPDFSPDGYWIVFVSSEEPGNQDIFIMRTNGTDLQRITTDGAMDFDPAWRPSSAQP